MDVRAFDLKPLEAAVKKSVEQLGTDLRALRVGAASPSGWRTGIRPGADRHEQP